MSRATPLQQIADIDRHAAWHASLLNTGRRSVETSDNGSETLAAAQRGLLAAADAGVGPLADYMFDKLGVDPAEAETAVPALPHLTRGAMQKLPQHDEKQIADHLHPFLSRAEAASPAVWALCHAVWISRGCFNTDPAAVFCQAPAATTPDDTRVRNFLRRTGGLHVVRGNVSVLVNCPVAAAYWRRRIADVAASAAPGRLSVETAHAAIWPNQVWDAIAGMAIEKVTAVSAPQALAAIITEIAQRTSPPTGSQTQAAIRSVGRLSHGRCLALTDEAALRQAASTALR